MMVNDLGFSSEIIDWLFLLFKHYRLVQVVIQSNAFKQEETLCFRGIGQQPFYRITGQ
jgi:hypothetical protein